MGRIAEITTTQTAIDRQSTHSSQKGDASKPTCRRRVLTLFKALNDSEKSCMRLFSEFDVSDYQAMLPRPARGTCQWVLNHPSFVSWFENPGNALLWLTGHPGCGKTILSLYLAEQLEAGAGAGSQPSKNVCVFFCDDKIGKQKDARSALAGLILQLIRRHPSLVQYAAKVHELQGQSTMNSFTGLWNIFAKICADTRYNTTYVIIDALDECEKGTRTALLEAIRRVAQTPGHQGAGKAHVKFVLTSRPFLAELSHSRMVDGLEYRISIDEGLDDYQEDIRAFIQQRVGEISQQRGFPQDVEESLQRTLLSRSGHTFLWIHMALVSLENSPLTSRQDLEDAISRIPAELETTYMSFLSVIAPNYEDLAARMLKLILGSSKPLSLDEFNIALTIRPSCRTAEIVASECQIDMLHTLQSILGPLVRVSESKVKLVHQSAKEFILQSPDTRGGLLPAIRTITTQDCALAIATACIDYMLLDDFVTDLFGSEWSPSCPRSGFPAVDETSPASSYSKPFWGDDVESLNQDVLFGDPEIVTEAARQYLDSRYPFYQYSALNWAKHFAACEASAPPRLREAAKSLLDKNASYASNWLRYFGAESNSEYHNVPSGLETAALAAYFNLHETLSGFLAGDTAPPQAELDRALFWAAEQGHSKVVETLIEAGANPNAQVAGRQSSLPAASQNGHFSCVVALLACDRTDLNARGGSGRTALSSACSGGYTEIVKILLSQHGCMVDVEDDFGATALLWAAGGGHAELVSLVVSRVPAIDTNHRDKNGRTTLSWAAGDGMDDVVGTLLKIRQVDLNLPDNRGRSPLSWAAGNGCTTVVKALMRDKRADKASVDHDGRNAISWAAAAAHVETLRVLLKYGCSGVDDRDANGWTPLAWAIQLDSPSTVETLLSTDSVDLERGDHSGRTVLTWAVEYGHLRVVRALLRAGANPHSTNEFGITPLSTAERFERDEIREELLFYMENMR